MPRVLAHSGMGSQTGTQATSINEVGTIVGYYTDPSGITHNFLRAPNGTITNIDPQPYPYLGADTAYPIVINAAGVVAGNNPNLYPYNGGFLLTPGAKTPVPLTGVGVGGVIETFIPTGINPRGAIAGCNGTQFGFLRNPDGKINQFGDPTNTFMVTAGINPKGVITGYSLDSTYIAQNGFVWAPPTSSTPYGTGTFTYFDPPVPGPYNFPSTYPCAISPAGTVTGYYLDAALITHGFLWTPPTSTTPSTFTTFDFPNLNPGDTTATEPLAINATGVIAGNWQGSDTVYHGFLRTP
jgi:hypothetical protein